MPLLSTLMILFSRISNEDRYSIVSLNSLDLSVNNPDCKSNDVNRYGPIIKVIRKSLRLILIFKKDQDVAKDINPKVINVFSLKVKFKALLKKIKYIKIKEIINIGTNFDVTKTMKDLYFVELNKYLIPIYEFKESIDDIWRG